MNRLKTLAAAAAGAALMTIAVMVPAAPDVLELIWDDLIPEDYVMENPLKDLSDDEYANLMDGTEEAERLMSELRAVWDNAPVVEKLDGQTVSLPGFVVPLDFEAEKIREFLLVPYFGACIHVPPPPANQIVFVKSDKGIEIERLYDAVIIQGRMETTAVSSALAQAGYTLHATDVSPYEATPE
ncbi:MAG: DUF3299 domain-containing protein [Gammaproteobacteria bacterium]|nr:DUF3299 domain-containing protein [Gammaproteobacteria bacterium]